MEKVDKELADFLADFEEVQDVSRVRENRDALFPILTMNEKERLLLVHRLKSAKTNEVVKELKGKYYEDDPNLVPVSELECREPETYCKGGEMRDKAYYDLLKKEAEQGLYAHRPQPNAYKRYRWRPVLIPQTRKECCAAVKNDLRYGVPDDCRPALWKALVGATELENKDPQYYRNVLVRVFTDQVPTKFYQVPAFGGELRPGDHVLTQDAIAASCRLLWALTIEHPDIDYVPPIADLVCTLLAFLSEAEAYAVAYLMIKQSREDLNYLPLSNSKLHLFMHTFRSFIDQCLPKISSHMNILGVEVENFAEAWFKRLFVGSLPYTTVLHVYDCYLAEGRPVIYRVGLAILHMASSSLLRCDTATQFVAIVEQMAMQLTDSISLMKIAMKKISFKLKDIDYYDARNAPKVSHVNNPSYRHYSLPAPDQISQIISNYHFQALHSFLSGVYAFHDPYLIFSSSKHGFSLVTLLHRCKGKHPLVMFIKDDRGNIFGGFSTKGFRVCGPGENYYGESSDFLFTLEPKIQHWEWTIGQPQYFVRVTNQSIQFGDSKALCIDEELWHGTSDYSKTFMNEPLCSPYTEFKATALEVWGFRSN